MAFQAYYTLEGDKKQAMLLLADHATRHMPEAYGTLGLPKSEFDRHIAYDIGIEALTRALHTKLKVPAVMSGFSRLLIDPNRGEDDPTLIMQLSDGTVIPGNYPLSLEEKHHRLEYFHRPYHQAIDAAIEDIVQVSGTAPFLVSLHSFTPTWRGKMRPWHAGLLWDSDPRALSPLLNALRAEGSLIIGDNEPYDGALKGDTLYTHATSRGFAHILIEVRQDLIDTPQGVNEWSDRLAPLLQSINNQENMHKVRFFASRTG